VVDSGAGLEPQSSLLMPNADLRRKLNGLNRRIAVLRAVANFLRRHPSLASWCVLVQMGTKVALNFDNRAIIRPVGRREITLRMERYIEDWDEWEREREQPGKRSLHPDVSRLPRAELVRLFSAVGIDLVRGRFTDEDEDDDDS
jgi:hypothetical protein